MGVQIIKQVQNYMTKTLSSLKVAAKKLGVQLHTLHTRLLRPLNGDVYVTIKTLNLVKLNQEYC